MKWVFALVILLVIALIVLVYWETNTPKRVDGISVDYFILRDKFREAVQSRNGLISTFLISAEGPNGKDLTVDFGYFGDSKASKVLVHISGTHGVEGYIGSAIQSKIISSKLDKLPEDTAIVFIHGLNPWGMAHARRFNEENVDLNRNFYVDDKGYQGAPEAYRSNYNFLNPSGIPERIDTFYLEALFSIGRYGFANLKQAITQGQYDFADGIYYGGSHLQESLVILRQFIEEKLVFSKEVVVIEVHTGLSEWGKDILFINHSLDSPLTKRIAVKINETFANDDPTQGVAFKTSGDLQKEVPKLLTNSKVAWILQEFGTYNPVSALRALRNEHRYHNAGGRDILHWSKAQLVEKFCPSDLAWQASALARGEELFDKALYLLNQGLQD
jgi:hypothetical protein